MTESIFMICSMSSIPSDALQNAARPPRLLAFLHKAMIAPITSEP